MKKQVKSLGSSLAAAWLVAFFCCATVLLSACMTRPLEATDSAPLTTDFKDRVTASDESEGSKRANVRMELAAAYFGRGQMTTALDQVKLAIAANPALGSAYNLRGLIYANLGDDRLADESFRRALQLNPRDADALQNFGYYLCQKTRYAQANDLFEQALATLQYRDSSRTLLTQGVCQALAGQLAQAEATLLRAHEQEMGNPSISLNLADVLYKRGEFERARFYIRRVNLLPAVVNAQTLWLAIRIEHRLGNAKGVKDMAEELQKRFADSGEARAFSREAFDE
jgi:type IV pilus assembly protein PilF